jgi:hypothetical protein
VYQAAEVPTPNCPNGNPDLVTGFGTNGWATQAEAQAVVDRELGQRNAIAAQVKAANEKAVSPGNIAAGLAKDAAAAAEGLKTSPWVWFGAAAGAGLLLWKVLK